MGQVSSSEPLVSDSADVVHGGIWQRGVEARLASLFRECEAFAIANESGEM